ncbi:MAG: hypothetical protein KGZ79_15040 [Dethiobacter sp.]|nr:hypothetical protein [Dethiobacter sp.]
MGRLNELLHGFSVDSLKQLKRKERNDLLRRIKAVEGASIRQIAKVTGLGRNIIANA